VLDAEQAAAGESFPGEPTTTVTSEVSSEGPRPAQKVSANGNGNRSNGARNGSGNRRAAVRDDADAR
jgi:hypothetical protein